MIETSSGRKPSAFSTWLRTGKRPIAPSPDGLELKFNPWHDPANGRFTFAGTGRHYGNADAADRESGRMSSSADPARAIGARHQARNARRPIGGSPPPGSSIDADKGPAKRASPARRPKRVQAIQPDRQPNPVTAFVGGAVEGLYGLGKETVTGIHAALTTDPLTTVRNANFGIAGMIETAIAAEDTPARIQVSRAARAVANASARDLGRATGTVGGSVLLAAAPGGAFSKVTALRRLRNIPPRPTYPPPQIGWAKETTRSQKPWKRYNDAAPGARAGQAPTLMRTMPDGSKRPVKFDGIQGDYVVDRKWSVVDRPRARAQILRQSEVLAEHRLIALWEVPTPLQKAKARKLLKAMGITNIQVKVVKP